MSFGCRPEQAQTYSSWCKIVLLLQPHTKQHTFNFDHNLHTQGIANGRLFLAILAINVFKRVEQIYICP